MIFDEPTFAAKSDAAAAAARRSHPPVGEDEDDEDGDDRPQDPLEVLEVFPESLEHSLSETAAGLPAPQALEDSAGRPARQGRRRRGINGVSPVSG